jgi:hypothetical protein
MQQPTWIRLAPLFVLAIAACERDNPGLGSASEGDSCAQASDCGGGLVCARGGTCEQPGAPGTVPAGATCEGDDACAAGLYCNRLGLCEPGVQRAEGGVCTGDEGCLDGLVCGRDRTCQPAGGEGARAEGDACDVDDQCGYNLVCGPAGLCAPLAAWAGVECDDAADGGPPRILFEIPGARAASEGGPDWLRLPFPNDVLQTGGVVDLGRFPGADVADAPGELLRAYRAAVREETRGFGLNNAALFRFSETIDFETLVFGENDATFVFVDVTPGSENKGRRPRSRFFAATDRGRYICRNWLGIRPTEGSPLEPDSTYAVIFLRGITNEDGVALEPDADFAEMLADRRPVGAALEVAWDRYAPLRAWLAEEGIPTDDVVGGTVFTTGSPHAPVRAVREAIHGAEPAEVRDGVRCIDGATSPCEGEAPRTCGPENDVFTEYHARLALPEILRGVPPYSEGGGDVVWGSSGRPIIQRRIGACMAVTVPRGDTPAGGWPVVIYAHDDGGSFREFVANGLAGRLAKAGFAVVGIDRPFAGDRIGDGDGVPTSSYPLDRPALARDRMLQEVSDLFHIARGLTTRAISPTGANTLSSASLAFFGHGTGGQAGVLFLSQEPDVAAGVFSATGGGFIDLLLGARAPVDVAAGLRLDLAEDELNGMHPAMSLLQRHFDGVDPMNHAGLLHRPPEGIPPKHLFLLVPAGDRQTAPGAMESLAYATRVVRVGTDYADLGGVREVEGNRAQGNQRIAGMDVTRAVKTYPEPDDIEKAHDAAFSDPEAIQDVDRFFQTLVESGVPAVE